MRGLLRGGAVLAAVSMVCLAGAANASDDLDSLRVLIRRQRFEEARALLAVTPAPARPATRADSLRVADLGDLHAELAWRDRANMPAAADSLARVTVARRERLHGDAALEVAVSLSHLGRIQRFRNDLDNATATLTRSAAILQALPGRDAELATGLVALGLLLRDRGEFIAARDTLERAVELRRRALGPRSREVGGALNNLALVVDLLGDRSRSTSLEREAIQVYESLDPPDSVNLYIALSNHAGSLMQLNQWDEGLRVARRADAIARASQMRPRNQLQMAELLGRALGKAGTPAEAHEQFERGRRICDSGVRLPPDAAPVFWGAYGIFEREQCHLDSALAHMDRARGLLEPFADAPEFVGMMAQLQHETGSAHLLRGDFAAAQRSFANAGAGYHRRYAGGDHPDVAGARHDWVVASYWLGRRDSLLELELEAGRQRVRHLRRVFSGLSEEEAMRYRGEASDMTRYALAIALEDPARAPATRIWDELIRSHAQVLDAMASRTRFIRALEDTTLRPLARDVERARLQETEALALDEPRRSERLHAAAERHRAADRALAERSQLFRRDREREDVGFDEVARALPAKTALVQYVRYSRWDRARTQRAIADSVRAGGSALRAIDAADLGGWAAFVLRGGERTPKLVLLDATGADAWLEEWSEGLRADATRPPESKPRTPLRAGKQLRRAFWEPIAPLVAGAELVLVVPDGGLGRVNLATLPDAAGRPLLEVAPPFSMLTSPRDVVAMRETGERGTGLLALGDPDFDRSPSAGAPARRATSTTRAASDCLLGGRERFSPLPATRSEVESVRRLCPADQGGVSLLVGEAASRAAFLAGAPGRRTLHVATHGFFLSDACLSEDERRSPLLRVGLALAGANRTPERALVTAAEIALLPLEQTELAVLSACSSGAGSYIDGEGIYGMARAFALAGVRTTVLSLDPVHDEVAALWMTRFYEARWKAGVRVAEAARDASRSVRREMLRRGLPDHPSQWGSFVVTGGY